MAQPTPAPRRPWFPTKCPATPPITAPFTHPAASEGPDDRPTTASIAAAATSIDFMSILLKTGWIAHWPFEPPFDGHLNPATALKCVRARLLELTARGQRTLRISSPLHLIEPAAGVLNLWADPGG